MTDDWLTVLHGDCRDVLATLPDESVHCVVTSPPYWGLRDYGTASWDGGDPDCKHRVGGQVQDSKWAGAITTGQRPGAPNVCKLCGATRIDRQIGLEPTPEEYVATMVGVFREVRRVLRKDGTLWLNLGDSYNSQGGHTQIEDDGRANRAARSAMKGADVDGLKPKDLVGIPWRVAFALQADGWYLRSDIIWSKPNPMPESVTDRPTKSHEYLFLLTRSATYHYDADAIREEAQDWSKGGPGTGIVPTTHYHPDNGGNGGLSALAGRYKDGNQPTHRNRRSVWTIATQPYPGAHFATFPQKLVEPCLLAGCPDRCCSGCGAPYRRVVSEPIPAEGRSSGNIERKPRPGPESNHGQQAGSVPWSPTTRETVDWVPTCKHEAAATTPGVVLDPFAGTGTVGMVAQKLSRRAVLIDLNGDYLDQLRERNAQAPLGLVG